MDTISAIGRPDFAKSHTRNHGSLIKKSQILATAMLKGSGFYERLVGELRRTRSHSQFGEDVHLAYYYKRLADERGETVQNGFFVDIGAFRPILYSNSYSLYKAGWRGINIDPTPGSKRLFDKVRPHDINIEAGIATEAGSKTLYVFGQPSVWNTFDQDTAMQAARITDSAPREASVPLTRLDAILDTHLGGRALELLLIDAEGYDMQILHANDFNKYRPRVILIEVLNANASNFGNHPVVQHLKTFGYALHAWLNPSLMLVREDSVLAG